MTTSRSARLFGAAFILMAATTAACWLFWPAPHQAAPAIDGVHDASAERGRYLATIGNCTSCHTARDGKPFAGGVSFHTPFGVMYSTNITQDARTGIGLWSFDDFYQAMKHGVRPDGTQLYPAFPYTSFARLDDSDLASIYLYLKTIAPVAAPAPANQLKFPFNLRFTLRAWNRLFHDPQTFKVDASKSAQWNRGAYLVEGPGHCGACHTPRNLLGAEEKDMALTGGTLVDAVRRDKYRTWSSVNLTSAPTGLAAWSADAIVAYLKHGENDHAVLHGPMNEVVLNSTRYLDDADARAIAIYLKALPGNAQRAGPVASTSQLHAGEMGYTVHCGTCHLPTGLGDKGLGVTLAGNAIVQASDPASLINVILYAPHLPPPPFVADRSRMKPFGKWLSDQEVADIATYLRGSFGNTAGAVNSEQVKRQR